MIKFFKQFSIIHLLIIGLIIKLIVFNLFAVSGLSNEWEIIIHNKEISGIFGINVASSEYIATPKLAENGERVLPTVFMPSLYYYFIYVLKFFSLNENNVSNYIILFQILLSLASVAIFYRLLCNFLSKRFSIILTSIFLFFPLNVYASIKISSITLQIFLLINFFYFLIEFLNKKKFIYIFFFSFFPGY